MNETYKISVIGSGSWGTAVADLLASKGLDICFYIRRKSLYEEIVKNGENKPYLPGIKLSENLMFTNDLEYAASFAQIIILGVPVKYLRGSLSSLEPFVKKSHLFISLSKGIENDTFFRPSEIIADVLKTKEERIMVLSGPNFAKEVAKRLPAASVLASKNRELSKAIQPIFNTRFFRIYSSNDVIGVETAAAIKNVVAIASGISDGLGFGYNAKASLITRGLAEIVRLGSILGAKKETFMGLAGIGDLVLTCTGDLSRNRKLGLELAKKRDIDNVLHSMTMVAEGVNTVKSVFDWSVSNGVDMPISKEVYEIIYNNKDPLKAAEELMKRPVKDEFI